MLRILNSGKTPRGVALRLSGQVRDEWVEELRQVCDDVIGRHGSHGRRLLLDLSEVSYIDPRGIALFRELAARDVIFTNCSLFAAEQLRDITHAD